MSIYKTKPFTRFARRERILDSSLIEAIDRAERGLVDADLGRGLIKQRVPRTGQGRRGGYRPLLAFRAGDSAIFLFGFAKSERENIGEDELDLAHGLSSSWLAAGPDQMRQAILDGLLTEVRDDDQESDNEETIPSHGGAPRNR